MGKDIVKHPGYEQMQDTPWITQAREIADIGGQGILDNYKNVDVFNDETLNSISKRNREVYDRAFDNMEREYTNTMNKYAANNYNRFGSLNSTPSAYVTDEYQRQFQRKMDDLAYNQALHYEDLVNNELKRRYDTLNMYDAMYDYGQIPYELDLKNWEIRNTNRDVQYSNALAEKQAGGGFTGALKGGLSGAATGFLAGGPWGALAGAIGGGVLGSIPQQVSGWQGSSKGGGQSYWGTPYEGAFSPEYISNLTGAFGTGSSGGSSSLSNMFAGGLSGNNGSYLSSGNYSDSSIMNALRNIFGGGSMTSSSSPVMNSLLNKFGSSNSLSYGGLGGIIGGGIM